MMRRDQATSSGEGPKTAFAVAIVFGCIRSLAVKSKFPALTAGIEKSRVINKIEVDAIEDGEAEGARRQQTKAERGQQGQAFARVARPEILGEVGGPDDQSADPRARRSDLLDTQHAARRLNHAPDQKSLRCTRLGQHGLGLADGIGAFDLRQQDGIDWHARRRDQVLMAPFRRQRVDTEKDLALAIAARSQGPCDAVARRAFRVRRNSIFEIENKAVGCKAACLLKRARIGARHEEDGTARAQRSRHDCGFLLGDWLTTGAGSYR